MTAGRNGCQGHWEQAGHLVEVAVGKLLLILCVSGHILLTAVVRVDPDLVNIHTFVSSTNVS